MIPIRVSRTLQVSPSTQCHTRTHAHARTLCWAAGLEGERASGSQAAEDQPAPHPPPGQNLRDPPALRAAEAREGGAPAHDPHSPRVPGGQEPQPHRHGRHLYGERTGESASHGHLVSAARGRPPSTMAPKVLTKAAERERLVLSPADRGEN